MSHSSPGTTHHHDLVILGGGLAGLAASVFSGAPVYEAEDAAGGVASSDRTGGFTFDRGIHILQSTNPAALEVLNDLGVSFKRHQRKAFIYSHRTFTPYPFQINTSGLPVGLRARCLWGFVRRSREAKPNNYEEWLYTNLGKGFADTFLIPYSEKFWTIHPREMTYEWAGNRVPQPSLGQVIRGAVWSKQTRIGSNAEFRYPSGIGGYGEIGIALQKRAGATHVGHRATAIETNRRYVQFSNGASIRYETLINTIPIPEFMQICRDVPEEVRAAAAKLRTNSILVVNLGIDRPNLSDRHWIHFPEKDVSFFRISYPHTFGPDVAPKGCSSISAEVAYSDARPIDKKTIVDRVTDDLIRVGALGRNDRVALATTRDIKYAYCIYDLNRQEALRSVLSWMRSVNIVPCGRYGLWTYFWSDESILSGKKAADVVRQRMEQAAK